MKRKWWIVGILVLLELLVCGGILLTLWAGRTAFEGVRFFYRADIHVEETVEETFVVDGPAIPDLQTDFAVTVTEFEERHIVGEVNGGGPLLQIHTDSGDITLESATGENR